MNASEMTNDQLANELLETVGLDGPSCQCDRCVAVREAAARLLNVTVHTDNSAVIAELQRRLKVAEDALSGVVQSYDIIGADPDTLEDYGTIKESAYAKAKNALAAIREEGGAK